MKEEKSEKNSDIAEIPEKPSPNDDLQEKKELTTTSNAESNTVIENPIQENTDDATIANENEKNNVDVQSTNENAPTEPEVESTVQDDKAPIEEAAIIPEKTEASVSNEASDLTPDEALNELVSSDTVTTTDLVAPAVQHTEDKMNEDTAVAQTDDMNVEENEAANAMDAAPIKLDEEQMDVDESNSPDNAMDH